ncbi:hypothetical protein C5167_009322 [Papaver somniferum]|uniref:SHSP domain-containing protein n=1 Tax=Papaver somniferum TaxID=3469 RepID=A0A4Y7JX23_PAPSO|nr:15.4 kDa class V heat shock protein-like [Papaver somniferum]RZC65634.1 hypothetical protein C5167_009322 [Papaver somniferum]
MEFTFQESPWSRLFLNTPFLFPSSLFTPDNYVHWTQTLESHIYTANLPGVRKEEIKVEVEDSKYLIIRTEEINEETKPAVSFMRKFRLPGMIDIGSISAAYEDGVLTATVPRTSARRLLHIHLSDLPGRHEILAAAA